MLLVASPRRRVRMPVSPLPRSERSSSGTLEVSISPRIVSSSAPPSGSRSPMASYFFSMNAFIQSSGTGKRIVEFFSAAISVSVCR